MSLDPCTHLADPEKTPSSWLQISLAPFVEAVWRSKPVGIQNSQEATLTKERGMSDPLRQVYIPGF